MDARLIVPATILGLLAACPEIASAGCKLGVLAELPVTMTGMHAMVAANFDGHDTRLIADSGAFYSLISLAVAKQFKLRLSEAPEGLRLSGIGNDSSGVSIATVKKLGLAKLTIPNVEFLAGGSEMSGGSAGILGQNVLGFEDAEYDLAKGVIRLVRPHDCAKASLAYWDNTGAGSELDIERLDDADWHTVGTAYVNGKKIRAEFDTGASASMLSLRAAARAGVKVDDAGVVAAGEVSGIGRTNVATWIAPFATFAIGQEEIRNTHLRIGELMLEDVDMLIGADFFLSHHVYVANGQHKLYFTYNGGPVFNLTTTALPPAKINETKPRNEAATPATPTGGVPAPDASELARRGAASAARRDYAAALDDLTRACELDPKQAGSFYQRSMVYMKTGKREAALADVDHALQLTPTDTNSLLLRAQLRQAAGKAADATADLQAIDRTVAQESDVRFTLAERYLLDDQLAASLVQFDLWIKHHPEDSKLPYALTGRCWAHGLLNSELQKAEGDCNRALRLRGKASPEYPELLGNRGLVRLRLGKVANALEDYQAALAADPKIAWSLYGRGLCELRLGKSVEGNADIAAAAALQPEIAAQARSYGLAP
jgi:tetratricopeptide (TPR) repeat protein